jgi:predicted RNase H-like HicB family nuclease
MVGGESSAPGPYVGTVFHVSESLTLTITYERGEGGFVVASIPEVPGTISQGRTRAEARANVIDALRLMLRPDPGAPGAHDSEPLQLLIDT